MIDIPIHTAAFNGPGRRIKKVVTNSGDLDGTIVYYWDGQQIIETRDGSGDLETQVYYAECDPVYPPPTNAGGR